MRKMIIRCDRRRNYNVIFVNKVENSCVQSAQTKRSFISHHKWTSDSHLLNKLQQDRYFVTGELKCH